MVAAEMDATESSALENCCSEPNPCRRKLATALGADGALDPSSGDSVAEIREATGGGADICLDCSGQEQTALAALDAACIYGKVGFIGEKATAVVCPSKQFIHKELTVSGSWYFTAAEFHEQATLFSRGFDPCGIVTHRFDLADAVTAYATFAEGSSGKVLFESDPSGSAGTYAVGRLALSSRILL